MTVESYRSFVGRNLLAEVVIRSLGVGLVALATVAAAGFILRQRRAHGRGGARRRSVIDALYAAGL